MHNYNEPSFEKLTSKVPGVIFQFRLHPDGRTSIPFASKRIEEVIGLKQSQVKDDATPFFNKVHPDDLQSLFNSIEQSRKNLSDWYYEFIFIKDDQETKWLKGLARPEKTSDGGYLWHGYVMDVTENKEEEQKNLKTQKKYKGYIESARDGLFVVNRQGKYLEVNPAACRMTGYSMNELLNMEVKHLVHPAFNEEEKKTLQRSFQQGSIDEEIRLKKKNGDALWVRLVTSKIEEDVVIAFCSDITQRKYNEKVLNLQLEFQKLLASISSAFVNTTWESFDNTLHQALAHCGIFFNAQRSYVFQFSPDYTTMSNTHEWCASNVQPQIDNLKNIKTSQFGWWWEKIKNKKVIHIANVDKSVSLNAYVKDGLKSQNIKSLLSVPMISNGVLMGFLGLDRTCKYMEWSDMEVAQFKIIAETISNIFSKAQTEKALRKSENRYRLLAENARDMIYRIVFTPQKRYDYISPSSVNLTGYTPDEYYANPNIDNKIIHPEDKPVVNQAYDNPRRFEKPLAFRMIRKDGKLIWVELSNVPVFNDLHNLVAVEGIAREITEQKENAEKLRALNAELVEKKAALENLNQSLEKRVEQEVEKNRKLDHMMAMQARQAALGEMIANIAHQWRQPLNLLNLAVYDMEDAFEYGELDKKYMDHSLREMNNIIQKMSKTIDDFRSYFKSEKEKTVFKASQVISNALVFTDSYFKDIGAVLQKDIPGDVFIYGFASQTEQTLVNILKNALEALADSTTPEKVIELKASNSQNKCCKIEITNTGKSIPPENFPKIFDPYFSTKPQEQALGLGLYIAKIIIEKNMDGKIYFENVARGVKFTVELPCGNPYA